MRRATRRSQDLLDQRQIVGAPDAADGLTAKLIEMAGFEQVVSFADRDVVIDANRAKNLEKNSSLTRTPY